MATHKILIATKTYPSISIKYRETVCTAGVLLDEYDNPLQWIRIYPIRYRYLDFDNQQAVIDQLDLFEPQIDLEKIPYKFIYQFTDEDNISHKYSISDWEIMQLYRNCRDQSKLSGLEAEVESLKKVKTKLEDNFMKHKDLYFIVGNLKQHPQNFMIIGLFYPPLVKYEQMSLF